MSALVGCEEKANGLEAQHRGARTVDIEPVLRAAQRDGLLTETNPLALFFDMDAVQQTLLALNSSFGQNWLHCFAVKSNPVKKMLESFVGIHGMGSFAFREQRIEGGGSNVGGARTGGLRGGHHVEQTLRVRCIQL